jgi:hypothetical protein
VFARELLAGDAETRKLIYDAAAPCIQKVAQILAEGLEQGEVASDASPEVLALTFISLANMLLLGSWDSGASWPAPDDLPAVAAELFLHGVGSRG